MLYISTYNTSTRLAQLLFAVNGSGLDRKKLKLRITNISGADIVGEIFLCNIRDFFNIGTVNFVLR